MVLSKITPTEVVARIDQALDLMVRGGLAGTVLNELAQAREELASGDYVKVDNLKGVADLATFFAIGASTVSGWYSNRDRTGMPEPVTFISEKIPCWDGQVVLDWWTSWVPRKGTKAGTLPWEREA